MNRRGFIQVMVGGSSVVLVPGLLSGCTDGSGDSWLEGWKGPDPDETDIRWIVLSYAILAANPHNKQPWIVDLTGPDSFDLYVDRNRLLPETDPPARQIHIGQGTFLENLVLAARQHGHSAAIEYFPNGEYSNTTVEDKPVASVTLSKDTSIVRDRLFDAILSRQSNKRDFREAALSREQLTGLRGTAIESQLELNITDDVSVISGLAAIMTEAMRIEASDKTRDLETIAMFRFDDAEREKFRDGFGVSQTGASRFKEWMVETIFLSREDVEKDSTTFGQQAVAMTAGHAETATAFGWLSTANNSRLDQVVTGRAYERLNLTATSLGVAMHPMSQVLQEYSDMAELQKQFLDYLNIPEGHTVQMLFRLGIADPVEHAPRRNVRDLHKG